MKYAIVPVTAFEQNCSILWCERTRRAVVVDPGGDLDAIMDRVAEEAVELERILLTHGHIDHAGGSAELSARLGLPIEGPHPEDRFWLKSLPAQGEMFGLPPVASFTPSRWLQQGDRVSFGEQTLEVLHCPGHTPGHLVFFHRASRLAIVGDVLFKGAIGRTDLPGGDHEALIHSIRSRLFRLGDDVRFIPGHGPMSTIGEERTSNPFLNT